MNRRQWLETELRRAQKYGSSPAAIAYLSDQLSRAKRHKKRKVVPQTEEVIRKRIAAALNDLEGLKTYRIGKYVSDLGEKATTPCIFVEDKTSRMALYRVLVASMGKRPKDVMVCHRCDNNHCVNRDHFFWGTARDNVRDMVLKGRHGKMSGTTKTPEQVVADKRDTLLRLVGRLLSSLKRLTGEIPVDPVRSLDTGSDSTRMEPER